VTDTILAGGMLYRGITYNTGRQILQDGEFTEAKISSLCSIAIDCSPNQLFASRRKVFLYSLISALCPSSVLQSAYSCSYIRFGIELAPMRAAEDPPAAVDESNCSLTHAKCAPPRYLLATSVAYQGLVEYKIGPGIALDEERGTIDRCAVNPD
jgi:hypothetical protein